jgi:hypothetical protein
VEDIIEPKLYSMPLLIYQIFGENFFFGIVISNTCRFVRGRDYVSQNKRGKYLVYIS